METQSVITDRFDNKYPPLLRHRGPQYIISVKQKSGLWTWHDSTYDRAHALAKLRDAKVSYGHDNATMKTEQ